MGFLKTRPFRIAALLLVLAAIIFQATVQLSRNKRSAPGGDVSVPYVITDGRIPGHPAKTIAALHHIYQVLNTYQAMHEGGYPPDGLSLLSDISGNLHAYGFQNDQEVFRLLSNPDNRYADIVHVLPPSSHPITYYVSDRRNNGSLVGSVKPANRRDVVAWTDIYVHGEDVQTRNGNAMEGPVGFYLLLWDDGQVTKVPYDQVLYIPIGNDEFDIAFSGQAGVPASAVSYDQFYQSMGAKKGPRGPAPGVASFFGRS